MVVLGRIVSALLLAALVAGCGSASTQERTKARATPSPRGPFAYDRTVQLGYLDRGVAGRVRPSGIGVHDVTFRGVATRVEGYLLLPRGGGHHPAVVVVHGAGGDRAELLEQAGRLAGRGFVALTITEPSTLHGPQPKRSAVAYLRQLRDLQIRDVLAIRRAVDVLQSLPQVDPKRIGYLGWSAGGRNGTFVAESEPRVKSLVLLSTGSDPLSEFVARAPPSLRAPVRQILSPVDPLRAIANARPGTILLEDGTHDEVVPRAALVRVIRAAPPRTTVHWFNAGHALNAVAFETAYAWLADRLGD